MPRNPGKFKQKRGGGRSFTHDLHLNENGLAVSKRSKKQDDEDDEEEDNEEEEEEEEEEPQLSRAERKALMKKLDPRGKAAAEAKESQSASAADSGDEAEAEGVTEGVKKVTISDKPTIVQSRPTGLQSEKAQKDLARLAKIRKEREEAEARRKTAGAS